MDVDPAQRRTYYRCALALLRFVEARAPSSRRFGAEADALWRSFAGDLDAGDRIELLLRDADRQWGAAFGARAVFGLRATHEQDAFGASWPRLQPAESDALWTEASTSSDPGQPELALSALVKLWGLAPPAFELDAIGPSSRLVIAGCGALVAVARRFLADPDLSWPNQVIVVADAPGPRQLAAAIPALADHAEPTNLLTSDGVGGGAAARALDRLGAKAIPLISNDASTAEQAAATALCTTKKGA